MLKSAEWEGYIEIHSKKKSERRGGGPTALARHVLFMQVQMIMYHFKLNEFKCQWLNMSKQPSITLLCETKP